MYRGANSCIAGPRDRHQCRAEYAVVEEIALLEDGNDGIGLGVGFDLADRLVAVRAEFLAERVDFPDGELLEHRVELAGGAFPPFLEGFDWGVFADHRPVEAVLQPE